MPAVGSILDSTEVEVGDYRYRGHVVVDKMGRNILLYSSVPVSRSAHRNEIQLLCPSHMCGDVRKKIDTALVPKWSATLPDRSADAKELGIIALGVPATRPSTFLPAK
ncbi:MAG: hypothetical protein KGI70_02155 [Patescibacteria group bacterium]|nr:hypothetical protein [Patescibacteria group bacterium]